MGSKDPLVVIVGPTASGKTALAIQIAKKFNGEIICADSRTVYKELDISTAKPTIDEQDGIPHHMLDVVNPDESFTVADFKKLAQSLIINIAGRGKLPIIVGGSGLFVDALLYNYKFSDTNAKRDDLNPRHLDKTVERKRSELRKNTLIIGLKVERETLKTRITNRVDNMINNGLVDEIKNVSSKYDWDTKALHTPAFKAGRNYINGSISINEFRNTFIKNDFNLAKRQMTWFRRNKNIHWLNTAIVAEKLVEQFLSDNVV